MKGPRGQPPRSQAGRARVIADRLNSHLATVWVIVAPFKRKLTAKPRRSFGLAQ